MGNSQGTSEVETVGFRILGVQPNSPAEKVGLVSFFDFIVAVNGVPLRNLEVSFIEIIKQSEEQALPLKVYNCKNHSVREIVLVPSTNWPGEGMLGVTIRFDSYHDAEEHLCHVLEVAPNSPAELAGLIPVTDYLLGTAEKAFKDAETLGEELQHNVDKPVEFFVYNSDTDEVRVVVLMPSEDWDNGSDSSSLLGADVAWGFLHALPSKCCQTIGQSIDVNVPRVAINSPFGSNVGSTVEAAPEAAPHPSNVHTTQQAAAAQVSAQAPGLPTYETAELTQHNNNVPAPAPAIAPSSSSRLPPAPTYTTASATTAPAGTANSLPSSSSALPAPPTYSQVQQQPSVAPVPAVPAPAASSLPPPPIYNTAPAVLTAPAPAPIGNLSTAPEYIQHQQREQQQPQPHVAAEQYDQLGKELPDLVLQDRPEANGKQQQDDSSSNNNNNNNNNNNKNECGDNGENEEEEEEEVVPVPRSTWW